MANTITVICDLNNGDNSIIANNGYVNFTPTSTIEDSGTGLQVSTPMVSAQFTGGSYPTATLLATDWSTYLPANWTWAVSYTNLSGPNVPAPFTFYLPSGPASFTATQSSPCVFTWTPTTQMTTLPNGTGIQLTGGGLPGGFSSSTTYYVVNSSGTTFSLAATTGGAPLNSSGSGSGTLTIVSVHLSALVALSQGAPTAPISATSMTANVITTSAGALTANQLTDVDATAGTVTMTLPTTITNGTLISCEKYDSTTNVVNITGNIRGVASSTYTLSYQYESVTFLGYQGSWWVRDSSKPFTTALDNRYITIPGNLNQTATGTKTMAILDKGGQVFNVKAYGAKGNTKIVLDGAMSSSSNTTTLTSATANFTSGDVGKLISVAGAGSAGGILSSTIATFTNSTTVILANAASTTVSGAKITWGTDDTASIQAAMNAAGPSGSIVQFPAGNYLLTNHLLWDTSASSIATLAPSLQGSLGQGGPSIDAVPSPAVPLGVVSLMAHSTFPLGEFIFDYIGCNPAGGAAGNTGFCIQGFVLYCNSRAAGLRSFNSEDSDHSYIVINNAAAPNPANTVGTPLGAVNFLANPSFQSWNNSAERIYVVESAQHAFYLIEGSGSYVIARYCNSVNAGWAGFYALKNTMLIGCLSQGSGKNNPQSAWYNSEFEIGGVTMVGCLSVATGAKGPGIELLTGASNINNVITGCTFLGTNTNGLAEKWSSIVYVINGGGTAHHTTFSGCNLHTGSHTADYVYVDTGTSGGSILFSGCHFTTAGGALTNTAYNLNSTNVVTFKNCEGINPVGSVTVAVPATTVATTALPYDSWFYITGATGGTTAVVVSGLTAGPSITVPVSGGATAVPVTTVFVPANQTITPTYGTGNAPTWATYGV